MYNGDIVGETSLAPTFSNQISIAFFRMTYLRLLATQRLAQDAWTRTADPDTFC